MQIDTANPIVRQLLTVIDQTEQEIIANRPIIDALKAAFEREAKQQDGRTDRLKRHVNALAEISSGSWQNLWTSTEPPFSTISAVRAALTAMNATKPTDANPPLVSDDDSLPF